MIMTVKKDTDKNKKFDENDEVSTFEIIPGKETEPREIFSTEFKNKLKLLYNKQWKRNEK